MLLCNAITTLKRYHISLSPAIPYFTVEPEIQNKAEGETAHFYCNASGIPKPTIKWIYNGMPLEEAPYNPRRVSDGYSVTIYNLTKKDTGNYGCNASTTENGYVYKDVYVNVLGKSLYSELWCVRYSGRGS